MKVPGFWVGFRTRNGQSIVNIHELAAVEPMPNGYALFYLTSGEKIETLEKTADVMAIFGFDEKGIELPEDGK